MHLASTTNSSQLKEPDLAALLKHRLHLLLWRLHRHQASLLSYSASSLLLLLWGVFLANLMAPSLQKLKCSRLRLLAAWLSTKELNSLPVRFLGLHHRLAARELVEGSSSNKHEVSLVLDLQLVAASLALDLRLVAASLALDLQLVAVFLVNLNKMLSLSQPSRFLRLKEIRKLGVKRMISLGVECSAAQGYSPFE